ncbi:MAG: POTRA domain-containing protein [Ferruginibacter sp.]
MKISKNIILFFFTSSFSLALLAQGTLTNPIPPAVQTFLNRDTLGKTLISSIAINGNKKTKDYLIRREMKFKEGDSIKNTLLPGLIAESRKLIYNTTLFTEAEVIPAVDSAGLSISIIVKEKWYLFPTPQFKLVDRNFNEWIKRHNGDLNRVIYGLKFAHYNFSGRGDPLRIYLLTGYAQNASFSYSAPRRKTGLTEGFAVSASFTKNREISFRTNFNNQILFYSGKGFIRESISAGAAYFIRKGFYRSHSFGVGYVFINLDDSVIIKTGTDYFNSNVSSKGFTDLSYSFRHINVDNVNYPLKGNFYGVSVFKRGLGFTGGINLLEVNGAISNFHPHGKNWYSNLQLIGKIKAPFNLAYINRRALGFGDFYLRGLENYVIDGVAAAVAKYTLKKKLFSFDIPVPFNIRTIPKIPVAFFAKTFADAGISYIPSRFNTMLNNQLLYTAGFGLDVLTLYDINIRFEYSFNQLGQNGLFLHAKGGF